MVRRNHGYIALYHKLSNEKMCYFTMSSGLEIRALPWVFSRTQRLVVRTEAAWVDRVECHYGEGIGHLMLSRPVWKKRQRCNNLVKARQNNKMQCLLTNGLLKKLHRVIQYVLTFPSHLVQFVAWFLVLALNWLFLVKAVSKKKNYRI